MQIRTIATILACTGLALGLSHGSLADENVWRPYVDVHVRAGGESEVGQGNLFLPILQDGTSMFFADVRGQWTDVQSAEGNLGLGYREMLANDWIVGAYGFYDFKHSRYNNNFQQATVGMELLDVCNGLRVNGYIPDSDAETVTAAVDERAYYGVDFEYERLLLANQSVCDAEVWAAVGVFHFDNETDGFDNITGPRARVELRLFDLPLLGDDSRLVLAGQVEHDDLRGTAGIGAITLRIPFGPGGGRAGNRLQGLDRRMVAPIVRDIDIITSVGPSGNNGSPSTTTLADPLGGLDQQAHTNGSGLNQGESGDGGPGGNALGGGGIGNLPIY